jgi:hypothetical protein
MNRTIRELACWSVILIAFQSSFGQEISVRIIDAQNGRSVRHQVVWMGFYEAPANQVFRRAQYKTDWHGVAHIQLPAPPPLKISLSVEPESFRCAGFVDATTEDILNRGATSPIEQSEMRTEQAPISHGPQAGRGGHFCTSHVMVAATACATGKRVAAIPEILQTDLAGR